MDINEFVKANSSVKEQAVQAVETSDLAIQAKSETPSLSLDIDGVAEEVLQVYADIAYRVAGIRTSRYVVADVKKEIGGIISYLIDKRKEEQLDTYVRCLNRLAACGADLASSLLYSVKDFRKESPADIAYRLLKANKGNIATCLASPEGKAIPKWVYNQALAKIALELLG